VLGLIAAIGLSGFAVQRGVDSKEARDIFAEYYEDTAEKKNDLCDDKVNKAKPECATEAPEPEKIEQADPVAIAPSTAQVNASVRAILPALLAQGIGEYCANDACKGTDGESLVGEKGDKGDKGDPGEQGPPGESIKGDKGDPGTPATDEQILAAVALLLPGILEDYFEENPVKEITDVSCEGNLTPMSFTYTYSDGTTETIECDTALPLEESLE
jgi:hypothetical protein